jgi:acetoin utilization protein AcuB
MKAIPTVQKYMTTVPHTIGLEQTLEKAEKMMHAYAIRHLPVMQAGRLMGILTDRDIKLVESFKDVDPTKVTVEEAYTPQPFTITPNSHLDEVCAQMVQHKYGCVPVIDNNKLVGIFTWVDALKALDQLLVTRLKQ